MVGPSGLEDVGWDALSAQLFTELVGRSPTGVAVFDADGTLWDGDCGEVLYIELIQRGLIGDPSEQAGRLKEYEQMCESDTTKAYGWIVQEMAGIEVEVVRAISDQLMSSHVKECGFPPMAGLARWLEQQGWESWIVSASAEDVVRAGAKYMGLREERVLGVRLDTFGSKYLETLTQLPNLEGKVAAIKAHGLTPDLAAGNSINDIPMLAMSRDLQLCVNPCDDLYRRALKEGWTCVAMGV